MQLATLFLASLLPLLATTHPLHQRAGGPIATPIPKDCTLTNPLPHKNPNHTGPTTGFRPSPDFISTNLLYASYFEAPATTSTKDLAKECFEQCYGYGDVGTCLSAISAGDVPVPEGYYGDSEGGLRQACLLFGEFLNPGVFVEAPRGTWRGVRGLDLRCPVEEGM